MASPSTEQRELQLVESVDFKILAVANKEDKLHELLQRYLVPLILKADSPRASVRTKVIEILARLKTFIQPPTIILPVNELLKQYKSCTSPIVQQLDLSFIQHSLERLDADERTQLIPLALRGISAENDRPSAPGMLNIALRLLHDADIPPRGSQEDDAFKEAIGLSDDADAEFLANAFRVVFHLRMPSHGLALEFFNPTLSAPELALFSMERAEIERLFDHMSQLRVKLVSLLASGAFTDKQKLVPAVCAAAGHDNRAAAAAEEIIKRSSVSLEDEGLVKRLFEVYLNSLPVIRTRVLGILSKSALSTTMTEQITMVIDRDICQRNFPHQWWPPTTAPELLKLQNALFHYLTWVAHTGPSRPPFIVGSHLLKSMQEYLTLVGWPIPNANKPGAAYQHGKAYEIIGMLGRTADISTSERIKVAMWLFRSLVLDPTDGIVVSIDGALSGMSTSIPPSIGSDDEELKVTLLLLMLPPINERLPTVRSARHAVVKWANQCLLFTDILARLIDILAISARRDEPRDVIEQGMRGLDPWANSLPGEPSSPLPDWREMIRVFQSPDDQLCNALFGRCNVTTRRALAGFVAFNEKLPLVATAALRFCRLIMFLTALIGSELYPDSLQALERQLQNDIGTRNKVRAYLESTDVTTPALSYLKWCLSNVRLSPAVEASMQCFVDVASLSSRSNVGTVISTADESKMLLDLVKSNDKKVSSMAAKAVGITLAHPVHDAKDVAKWSSELASSWTLATQLSGPKLSACEGGLRAFAHLRSRAVYYGRHFPTDIEYQFHLLVNEYSSSSLYEAALYAFSELWTAGLASPSTDGDFSVGKIVEKLSAQAKKGNEQAVAALGRLAMVIEDAEDMELVVAENGFVAPSGGMLAIILNELFSLHEFGQIELQFTVGEAIVAAVARWESDKIVNSLDVVPAEVPAKRFGPARGTALEAVIKKLLRGCKATKPSLLRSSGIWLLCLVMNCSNLDTVQSRLREVQAAFMRLLGARDEIAQETASRGLSLVYERGSDDLKAALVKDLVGAFTGSGTQLKVDNETELFDPGALPTGEGQSVTSYKDIVNLANEVGDQRLVYKFMSLAADAATWSTRSAFGRFGLSSILSEAEVDPKLYPKLYRYRFDPNTNVQRSMDAIWKALVKDSSATVDKHFEAIMQDLLKSQLGREWRVRQASCAAISSLISGRPFAQYGERYKDIWTGALKVLDDVKGSVREAALRLCMALSNGLVRQLEDGGHSAAANAMMKEALPFLLSDKGVENSAKDVQAFATITLLKVAKKGGQALLPFIGEMVTQLLGLLSIIEPEQINYHYQRLGEEGRDKIDRIRSQMVNQSPISEAIEDLLRFVDTSIMAQMRPKLDDTIKTAVGMPTKIGCSRVLTTLATRHASLLDSTHFLNLLQKQVLDKNDEVSQAYARAAAYIWRAAPEETQIQFCEGFVDKYLRAENEHRRQKIADVIVALAKISPDHFGAHETVLLPLTYVGCHDTDEYTAKMFQEAWSQHVGGGRTVMRYVREIVALVEKCMDTTQWSLRHTAAFTAAALAMDVSNAADAAGGMGEPTARDIWLALSKTLALKTFPGKEKLLESFPRFVEQSRALWGADEAVAAQMKQIAVREAKRNNDEYRVHAFRCLWRFAKTRDDIDMTQEIRAITRPYLEAQNDGDRMDVDSKEDLTFTTAKSALEAVARGYPESKVTDFGKVLEGMVSSLKPFLSSSRFDVIRREVWYGCVCDLMKDATKMTSPMSPQLQDGSTTLASLLESLDMDQAEVGTEAQRLTRAKAAEAAIRAKTDGVFGRVSISKEVREAVASALARERSFDVQKLWRAVMEAIEEATRQDSKAA
ncbi:hypothetical protein L249_8589 [Ophiocordyceps polyrhachis-furcata BCC 54312]|uniref:Proteasome component ECM29 n=1 Tax=Ophiocordyceps polyrhachis-furcata BCC 54312 TaxID=1330021 RepID=A0A367L6V6_9HYPO|nr:hypothetical protein L249_8589 [Ophiocordyceps polyrhachis-furcata BCC 54312]